MTIEQQNEYMKNVKWTTAIYVCASCGSILIAIAGAYFGLKGDIKDSRTESKEQIRSVSVSLNRKIDSIHALDNLKFQEIYFKLDTIHLRKK